jgi:hypothetical protein
MNQHNGCKNGLSHGARSLNNSRAACAHLSILSISGVAKATKYPPPLLKEKTALIDSVDQWTLSAGCEG